LLGRKFLGKEAAEECDLPILDSSVFQENCSNGLGNGVSDPIFPISWGRKSILVKVKHILWSLTLGYRSILECGSK
jgi:hypothetical protein